MLLYCYSNVSSCLHFVDYFLFFWVKYLITILIPPYKKIKINKNGYRRIMEAVYIPRKAIIAYHTQSYHLIIWIIYCMLGYYSRAFRLRDISSKRFVKIYNSWLAQPWITWPGYLWYCLGRSEAAEPRCLSFQTITFIHCSEEVRS